MNPLLSLVTGTVDRPESFERLVKSIIERTDVPWELVVTDASRTPVTHDDPRVRILPERPRMGCVKGYNRAFRECRGEWVLYLNDDAEVLPGYARAAIDFMELHPQIGLGALWYCDPGEPFHVNDAWGCIYANFGILKRSLGDQVGWFDEDLIMYGNDNSLTLRVLLAGKGVADIPSARILHHSVQDQLRQDNQAHRMRDNQTLQHKYLQPHVMRQWESTYRRFRVGNTESWSHGRRPVYR